MSLINDALKRAEKSLNNNSSDQHKERIPSFHTEPSKKSKKLFIVILLGGVLFFSTLIALIMVLRSEPKTPLKTPPTNIPADTKFVAEINVEQEAPEVIQEPQELSEPENNSTTVINEPEPSVPSNSTTSSAENATAEPQMDLNDEFIQGIVGLASKAFTKTPSSNTNAQQSQEPVKENSKESFSLSTAQETLAMLEKQVNNSKTPHILNNPVQDFIQDLSITGVMIADDESQVLINNQVYTNNSTIEPSLNLKLIDIKPHKITIKDATGKTYTKEF